METQLIQQASFNGVPGSCSINDGFLFFQVQGGTYKWSFSTWMRSEKSKKTAKVRLTFTEGPLKLTDDESHSDALEKAVIVVDFEDDRDALELFTSLVSKQAAATKEQVAPAPSKEEPVKATESVAQVEEPKRPSESPQSSIDEQKKQLLDNNPVVACLYQQLVEAADGGSEGVISANDFWNHHEIDVVASLKQPEAPSHLEGFIAMPPTNEFVNGQLLYRYTPELGKALLAEDETIRTLHKKFIIDKQYPEENFWKRILQSNYFYNLIGEKIPENQILYDDIKGVPIKKIETTPPTVSSVLKKVDMFSDLIRMDDHRKRPLPTLDVFKKFGKQVEPDFKSSLFDRFNSHSCKIMEGCQATNSAVLTMSPTDSKMLEEQAETDRKRKIAEISCKDLAEAQDDTEHENDAMCFIQSLNMPGNKRTKAGSHEDGQGSGSTSKIFVKMRSQADTAEDVKQWVESMREFDILKYLKTQKDSDNVGRRMFILNTKLCQTEKITQTVPLEYDPSTVSKMRNFQKSIIEILQLYYKTLLPEEQKRVRLLLAIRQIKRELESLQEGELSAHAAKALQTGLMNQITAVEVYDTKLKALVSELRSQAQTRMTRPKQ